MQIWKGNTALKVIDWGWKKTDLAPAPDNLIKVVRCNCKRTVLLLGAVVKKSAL
jgi:hypothetical protein